MRVLGVRRVTVRLWWALWLWGRMVEEPLSGRSSRANVAPRWRRVRARRLAPMQGRPVNLHRGKRRVRGNMATIVQHDRRRRASTERTRRGATCELGWHWEGKGTIATSIGREERARATLHHERRTAQTSRRHHRVCICSRVHILRTRSGGKRLTCLLSVLQKLQTLRDRSVGRVELRCASVSVDGIGDLVVAALVQAAKVEPDFGDVRIDADGAGISVERVAVLVDLEVQDANGTPESRVAAVTVHGLLICFVRLVVLLTGHVRAPEKIPALGVARF